MNSEAADAIRTYAVTSPLSTLAGRDVIVREEWQGSDNLLWRLGVASNGAQEPVADTVLKMYMEAGWVRGRREYEAQQLFSPLGLAPQPLWFDRDAELLPRQVVGYAYVDGSPPDMADPGVQAAVAQAIARVHATDAAELARVSPNPMGFKTFWTLLQENIATVSTDLAPFPDLVRGMTELQTAASALAAEAAPLWANATPTPIHGEFSPENTLITPRGVTFVDWELSGLGDPALEVARFAQGHLVETATREQWLATYLAAFNPPQMAERIALYRMLLPIEWLCLLLGGLEDALATFGPEIRNDMIKLVDAVFAAAGSAVDAPNQPSRSAIEHLLDSLAAGGKQ
jgi:hypothetical protein